MSDLRGAQVDPKDAASFVFAGRCKFTLLRTDTGSRITFQFKRIKPKRGQTLPAYYENSYWVMYKYNEDTTDGKGYALIGTVYQGTRYAESRRIEGYKYRQGDVYKALKHGSQVMAWFLPKLLSATLPECIQVWHNGNCGRCGRDLTVPVSIHRGIGPECLHYMPAVQAGIDAMILEYLEKQKSKVVPHA